MYTACRRDGRPMKMDTQIAYDSRGHFLRFVCTYCSRDLIINNAGEEVSRVPEVRYVEPLINSKRPADKVSLSTKYYDVLKPRWDRGECGCGCGNALTNYRARWYKEHAKTWRRRILRETQDVVEVEDAED